MLKAIFININKHYYSQFHLSINKFFKALDKHSIKFFLIHDNFEEEIKYIMENNLLYVNECVVITPYDNSLTITDKYGMMSIGLIYNSTKQSLNKAYFLMEDLSNIDLDFLLMKYMHFNNMPAYILSTERLYIRELTCEDIKILYNIYTQPIIKKYINGYSSLDEEIEKHQAYIKSMYHFYGYGLWGIFTKTDNKLIGQCGLQNINIDKNVYIEIGYLLDSGYQGYGYAYEASRAVINYGFDILNLESIVAIIEEKNFSSIKTAKKLGLRQLKKIKFKEKECLLLIINNETDNKRHIAAQAVLEKFKNNPDTGVYSKIY